jgi:uncharacterized protein YraI
MRRFALSVLSVLALFRLEIGAYAQGQAMGTVRGVRMVHVRSGPGTEHPSLGVLREGALVEVLAIQDTWARIRSSDGRIGYINSAYLELRGGTAPATAQRVRGTATAPPIVGTATVAPAARASPVPTPTSRRISRASPVATATLPQTVRSPAVPTTVAPVASPTPTPAFSPPVPRVETDPGRPAERQPASEATSEPSEDVRSELRRVLRLTEDVHREVVGRGRGMGPQGVPDAPGVPTTLALAGAALVVGFLIGTAYGRRQERNRRTRVRF